MTRRDGVPKVVVIGAGVAGSVVAARLASRCHVVVLERGGAGAPHHHPALAMRDPSQFLATPYPQGIGLGGGSRVNGLVFEQPPAEYWTSLVARGLDVFSGVHDELARFDVEASAADGEVDRALLAAHPRARPAALATRHGKRITAWERLTPRGVTLRTGVSVSHLRMRGDRALAVVAESGDEIAADHVVLCAGAIPSATIAVRSRLIAATTRLLDHPGLFVPLGTGEPAAETFVGALALDTGVMFMSVNGGHGGERGVLVGLMSPHSTGTVHVGYDSVSIERGLLTDDTDRDTFRDALREAATLLSHPVFAPFVRPSVALDDERWMDRVGEGMWHAAGTMSMGATADSTLDESGRLRGTTNVWCMDASVFPEIPPVPPQAAVMSTASLLARRMLSLSTS